jgi:hypothetical protein
MGLPAIATIQATTQNSTVNPNYISCPSGAEVFSGTVKDQEGNGLGGVVVALSSPPNYVPSQGGSTTSDVNGYWSVTFSYQCPANANFYWQSQSQGPLVLAVSLISTSTIYSLNVWRTSENTLITYEFPNTAEASIGLEINNTYTLSADAKADVGIQDSFLGVDAGLKAGTELTYQTMSGAGGTSPYEAYYSGDMSIKVQDTNGHTLIYKQPVTYSGTFNTVTATEYLTSTQAIADGGWYQGVAANNHYHRAVSVTGVVSLDAQVSVTALGFSLGTEAGVSAGSQATTDWTITNNNQYDQCFIVYPQGPVMHIWLYSNSACP